MHESISLISCGTMSRPIITTVHQSLAINSSPIDQYNHQGHQGYPGTLSSI